MSNPDADAPELAFLGELEVRAQRLDLAEDAFRKSLANASPEDVESGAFTRTMLARLLIQKKPAEARDLLNAARNAYEQLGDTVSIADIDRLLRVLAL